MINSEVINRIRSTQQYIQIRKYTQQEYYIQTDNAQVVNMKYPTDALFVE